MSKKQSLNPYFFGKCSTASKEKQKNVKPIKVLILIFLENALRPNRGASKSNILYSLNPYFFGKCSTAFVVFIYNDTLTGYGLNPYFFGKCSTAAMLKASNLKAMRS